MGAFSLIVVIILLNRLCNWAYSVPRTYILSRMGRTLHQKSLKRAKAERVKNRLEKLEAVKKAKDEGTYIAKPWENRPLLQELYSFAIKTHKTKKASREEGDGESVSGDSIMDLDLRSPGTPRSLEEEEEDEVETGSVTSKDDRSSLTSHSSHSSKYSLKNIEKQLLQKMKGGAAVPDWLTKKERKRVYRNIQRVRKIKQTTRYKRIKRKLQAKENSKMDQSPSSKQSTSSSSSSAAAAAATTKCASKSETITDTS